MSIFYPELSLFRRSMGDLFDDFERTFYLPTYHTHLMDVDALPPATSANTNGGQQQVSNGKGAGSDTEMKRGENESQQNAMTTQGGDRSNQRALTNRTSPFTSLINRAGGISDIGIRLDVHEDKDTMNIIAELPHGVKKNDVNINVRGSVLSITCDKKAERKEEDKDKKYLLQEISYGTATRTIRLPQYVDINKLTAKFNDADGKLNITVPKKEESKNNEKKIEIQ